MQKIAQTPIVITVYSPIVYTMGNIVDYYRATRITL